MSPALPPLTGFTITEWHPHKRDLLRGFLALRLDCGLLLHNLRICVRDGHAWLALPNLPRLDREGKVTVDPETGKRRYAPLLSWPDRAAACRFSTAVIAALEAAYPGALAE